MFSLLKSTHAFNQEFSSGLKFIDLTFRLTHITINHGAFELSLGSWAIERQNNQVKHHVSSSLFNHYSRVFASFQKIKLRDSIVWHSQVSHIYGICGSSPRHNLLLAFFFLPLRLYVQFIGREKARAYLWYIYCTMLLENISLIWNLKTFARESGLSYSSFIHIFQVGI